MSVVWFWAARLVARGWRATVFLALLAGLAAGVAMAAWGAARRTEVAFDRFLAWADVPELNVVVCPPWLDEITEETVFECWGYLPEQEVLDIAEVPGVESTTLGIFRGATIERADQPGRRWGANSLWMRGTSLQSVDGRQLLLEGRWYADGATDEVVISEAISHQGIGVGDEVVVRPWGPEEIASTVPDGARLTGPPTRARVVGVARGVMDLAGRRAGNGVLDRRIYLPLDGGPVHDQAPGFAAVFVQARGGDGAATLAAIEDALPEMTFNATPAMGEDEIDPIRSAISYEARGTLVLAALLALAAGVFAGQAVARQSRREWRDHPTLRALGLTRGQAGAAAALRGAVTAVLATLVAVVVAVAASPVGPVGMARGTARHHGASADLVVLGVGGAALILVLTVAAWLPVRGRPLAGPATRTRPRAIGASRFPPAVAAGLGMSRPGPSTDSLPTGTALTGVALAVATALGAAALIGSLDALHEEPARFGAPWDLSIAQSTDEETWREALALLDERYGLDAVASISGADVALRSDDGDEDVVVWAQAFVPVEGVAARTVPAPLLEGRPPASRDEILLGSTTQRDLGVSIGDVVELEATNTIATAVRLTVVGTTMVNDTYEVSPGRGAVITPELLDLVAPESMPDPLVVQLLPGADAGAARRDLAELATGVLPPVPQGAIDNVDRIRELPAILVVVVSLLALASLVHALTLSVRRHRRLLAVLRSLGFTRRQVAQAVAVHATVLVLAAAAIGVPLGLVAGRWGWRAIATEIGVGTDATVPVVVALVSVAGVVVAANLVAALPAWRAGRTPTAAALRAE